MIKTFCDHCGKEISGVEINELCCEDCFYDAENEYFVGAGCVLCGKCWAERKQAHIDFDMKFLNMAVEDVEHKPITNYDSIISKTLEELAEFLGETDSNFPIGDHKKRWLDWLNQEV